MRKILTLALLLATAGMTAQEAEGGKWTLEACISHALEHNIQLRQRRVAQAQNEQQLKQSKAALFPSLSFSTNHNASWRPWSQSYVNLSSGTMTTTKSEVNYNGSYGLNANWTVWNGGRNRKNIKKNNLTSEMSEYDIQETANTIQEQITQYYVQILYQTEAVVVNEEVLAASKLQRDRAKAMVEVGSLAPVDLVQLEAQVAQDEYNVVNSRTQLTNYKLDLKEILELVGTDSFDIVIPEIDDASVLAVLPDKGDVYRQAYAVRPEIQSGKLSVESSDIDISIAKRGYLPTLSVSAGIGTSHSSGTDTKVMKQVKTNVSNSIGLSVSVPIFDGRQNKTNVEVAKLTKQNNELALQSTEKTLYTQIENYWLNARNAQTQYSYALKNEQSMQESYDLVSEQFRLGLKNIVELTTGKTNLLQAKQTVLQSKYTALLNIALLRFYQGEEIRL